MSKTIRLGALFLAMIMSLSLFAGCNKTASGGKAEKTESKEVKIEDIDWSVDEGVVDGERYVMLSYTNNSKFTVSGIEMSFTEKSGVTKEQKEKYFEDIKNILDVDESDPDDVEDFKELKSREISMSVQSEMLCKSGESVSNQKCHYYSGYYYLKSIEHFNLCEPDIATIKYVDKDKIYTVNYDFKSKKYTKDSKTEVAYYWSEKELGTVIPKPDAEVVTYDSDDDDSFWVDVHGWTLENFNAYVKECQEKGFTVDKIEHEGYYSAESEGGYDLSLNYDEDDGTVSVHLSKQS